MFKVCQDHYSSSSTVDFIFAAHEGFTVIADEMLEAVFAAVGSVRIIILFELVL